MKKRDIQTKPKKKKPISKDFVGAVVSAAIMSAAYSLMVISLIGEHKITTQTLLKGNWICWILTVIVLTVLILFIIHFAFGGKPIDPENTDDEPENQDPKKYMGYLQRLNTLNAFVPIIVGVLIMFHRYDTGLALASLGLSILISSFGEGKGGHQAHKLNRRIEDNKNELQEQLKEIAGQLSELQNSIEQLQDAGKKKDKVS